jgi:predicted component of type VI protein secretion system
VLFRKQYFDCISRAIGVLSKLSSPKLENWRVIYKVNPEMHTHRYDEYIEGHEDADIYQEELEVD